MSHETAMKAIEHNLSLRFSIRHSQDTDHAIAEVIDDALNCILTDELDTDVLKYVKAFPDHGAAGCIGFIRQRINAKLLEFESELLSRCV